MHRVQDPEYAAEVLRQLVLQIALYNARFTALIGKCWLNPPFRNLLPRTWRLRRLGTFQFVPFIRAAMLCKIGLVGSQILQCVLHLLHLVQLQPPSQSASPQRGF